MDIFAFSTQKKEQNLFCSFLVQLTGLEPVPS